MLSVVAIVGRPNVGKSTLFNRLTRSRDALMSSHPGMTRDRQYGQAEVNGHPFIVIDTGGLTDENDAVNQLIAHQALKAVHEADAVLFLVDARAGITADDKQIAATLRRTGKRILLVANKAEGLDSNTLGDAYELGMGAPIPIAAVHGQGITHLVETIFPETALPAEPTETEEGIRLAIVGRPNVGKSTLTNRLLGEERVIVHDSPGTTRDSIMIPLQRFDQQYQIIDTAGIRRRKNIDELPEKFSVVKTLQAIENANIVLYVLDARQGVSEQDLRLLGFILECGKGLVIAINKWDNLSEEEKTQTKNSIDRRINFLQFARMHFISALHGSGVGNLFASINEAYASATQALSTPVLTRLLQEAQTVHQPPLVKGRRIKLRYAHPGGHNPPRIIIHGNQVDSLPDSYRQFLAHFYQKKLNLHGTPVYIEFKASKNPYK